MAVLGLPLVAASGGYSIVVVPGLLVVVVLLFQDTGSRACRLRSCGYRVPEHGLSSCGTEV